MKKFLLILVLFTTSFFAQTQEMLHNGSFSIQGHGGFFIPHRNNLKFLQTGHTKGIAFSFDKQTYGQNQWEQLYNYPKVGFDFLYQDLGNSELLGKQMSAHIHVQLPISNRKIRQFVKLGTGVGYTNLVWDLEENVKSIVLSSPFNWASHFEYGANVQLAEKIELQSGLRLQHFSNASFNHPNKGTNVVTAYLGLNYSLGPMNQKISKQEVFNFNRSNSYEINVGAGAKEVDIADDNKYMVWTFRGQKNYFVSPKSSFGIGFDAFYNSSIVKEFQSDLEPIQINTQLGITGSYGLTINRLRISYQQGFYLYNKYKDLGFVYSRVGIDYQIIDNIYAGLFLKTHFAKADHAELTIAYRFKNNLD